MTYVNKFVALFLRHKVLIFVFTALITIAGIKSAQNVNRDILPDLSIPIINIVIENHSLAPEDVENLIVRPLESGIRSINEVTRVVSTCGPGLAAITVEFQWNADILRMKQAISEKIAFAQSSFPAGTTPPSIGTASSRLNEIFELYITGDTNEMQLRDTANFFIKPKLQTVQGVAKTRLFGGDVMEYQIKIDPYRLKSFNLTFDDIEKAVEENNHNFTGGIFPQGGVEYIIRGAGAISTIEDLESIIISSNNGTPVYLSAVASVIKGPALKRGLMNVNGKSAVSLTFSKQQNYDTVKVVENIKKGLDDLKKFLPAGIHVETFFDQSELIKDTSHNLAEAMIIGGIAIIAVIYFFLGNFIATLIAAITIPISVAVTFFLMDIFKVSANVMSLGGIVVGLGILVDAGIVICENIFRQISEHFKHLTEHTPEKKAELINACVISGTAEVFKPVLTSTAIICVVFTPLMMLSGFEGRVFMPFAFTMVISILTGLILSFTFIPPFALVLLKHANLNQKHNENSIHKSIENIYIKIQDYVFRVSKTFSISVFILLIIAIITLFALNIELLPPIDENAIMLSVVTPPGSSLAETSRLTKIVCNKIKNAPDVEQVLQRSGRAEGSDCVEGVNVSEPYVKLVPREKRTRSIEEISQAMEIETSKIPGILVIYTQPLANRIEETIAGTSAKFSIKLFGHDLSKLREKGDELLKLISGINGLSGLQLEQTQGVPMINIKPDRVKAAKFGINIETIAKTVELAFEGKTVSKVLNDGREYDIVARLDDKYKKSVADIGELYIDSPQFGKIKLNEIAEIKPIKGPGSVKREDLQRRVQITGNISGRDLMSIINDIKPKIASLNLPEGYFVSFGGNYEQLVKMLNEITYAFGIALTMVFMILYLALKSIRQSLMIICTIPLALIGGIFSLFITGISLNVSSLVGIIAHFGLSVQKGIILIEYVNHLREAGKSVTESVLTAGRIRLRPVLMTTFSTIFGVIPIALGYGAGAEMQQPMAIVLIGGLVTSTIFTLLLLPLFYSFVQRTR